jgi:hypothetical protein
MRKIGLENPRTLSSMENLAWTHLKQDQWKEAEELLVKVIEMRKKVLGEKHADTLRSMKILDYLYELGDSNLEEV